jgi:membrane-associated protease RseP (regulator of RpoE activity)
VSSLSQQVTVDIIFSGKPAAGAKLAPGDVIVAVGETSVRSLDEFVDSVRHFDLHQPFTLTVERAGSNVTLTVDPNYQPSTPTPITSGAANTSGSTSRSAATHPKVRDANSGAVAAGVLLVAVSSYLIGGVILIAAGMYFRGYAPQNFTCNLAGAIGAKPPLSCVWYQFTFEIRDWLIVIGIFVLGGGLVRLIGAGLGKALLNSAGKR